MMSRPSISVSRWLIVAAVFAQLLAMPGTAFSSPSRMPSLSPATSVGGVIAVSTTWTRAGNPYQVTSTVSVLSGVTLTLEPGVEVQFLPDTYLEVQGVLTALGTPGAPITFSGTTRTPGSWQGIVVSGSAQARAVAAFSYATIEFGGWSSTGANVQISHGEVNVAHSTVRWGAGHGIFGGQGGIAHISDTSLIGNARYAVYLTDVTTDPALARLSASGNGVDGVGMGGIGGISAGAHVWERTGIPYVVASSLAVAPGASVQVEPGVEVRFNQGVALTVQGQLTAIGTIGAPIVFTGSIRTPGSWHGIKVSGTADVPAAGIFQHTTIEYGGFGDEGGNIYVTGGRVSISHSTIRDSAGSGVVFWSDASGSVIEASRIVDNQRFGVYTVDPRPTKTILAANNWWGASSGPTVDTGCNPGGAGSRISAGVAFRPFLTGPDADPGWVAPSEARIIAITPQRWFAPADGLTRVYTRITLRDGRGLPLPGRRVQLQSSLGSVVDGGITDAQGQTLAYVTSTSAGDAQLAAVLDLQDSCEFARSPMATIAFTPAGSESGLLTAAAAPYLSEDIQVSPMPITRGTLTRLSARLTNPNNYPILVDASFGHAEAGIGLAFGPLGEVHDRVIPAHSDATIEVFWTPSVSGHYCVQLEYTARPVPSLSAVNEPSEPPLRARAQRNLNVYPGPFLEQGRKDSIKQAKNVTDAVSDAQFINMVFEIDIAGIISGFIPDQLFGNILDFIYDEGRGISCALQGGANCDGWKGPKLKLPGDTIGNLSEDPPNRNYRSLITVETLPFTPLQPGPDMPAARAGALNNLMVESLSTLNHTFAAAVSYDRYAGASEALDLEWASLQAGAYLYYLDKSAHAMLQTADAFDALLQEIHDEGITDVYVSADDFRAYQSRLRAQGFTAEEIAAARLVGFNDEAIEAIRQHSLTIAPETAAGSVLEDWANLAAALRAAGNALLALPVFGSAGSGTISLQGVDLETDPTLVRLSETSATVLVGNPLAAPATIELRLRPVDVPPDWLMQVTPQEVTLDPGGQQAVTVTVRPGAPVVQGTRSRVAVEGYHDGQLVGGVVVDLIAPRHMPFDGLLRIYLPLVRKH